MNTLFTGGEWQVVGREIRTVDLNREKEKHIAYVPHDFDGTEADLRLMAASKVMYKALVDVISYIDDADSDIKETISDAIYEATGLTYDEILAE